MRWQTAVIRETCRSSDSRRLSAPLARAPLIATLALGVAIAAQAADVALDLLRDANLGAATGSTMRPERVGWKSGAVALAAADIAGAHLFGAAPAEPAAASRSVSRAPLVLTGIIATGDPKNGFAILGPSAATARVFHTGSEATPGVTLAEVYPQWVVVLQGSERVTLKLPRASGGNQAATVRLERGLGPRPDAVAEDGDGGPHLPSPEDFKPPPMSTASTLIRAFALRPVAIGGERGVRIMGTGINSAALAALGLAPGDVITQINGVPIGTRNTPDIGKALNTGGVTLVVNRDGDETSVTIDAGSAANAANAYRASAPEP